MRKKKILIIAIVSIILIVSSTIVSYTYCCYVKIKEVPKIENYYFNNLEEEQVIINKKKELALKDEKYKKKESQYKEIEGISNILIIGIDDRGASEPVRSDTIMILTLDQKYKKIKLTSIMRDAYVEIPEYSTQKINHAFAFGGVDLLMKTISYNFNIKLNKYIKINFDGFKDLVDAINGIDVKINNYEELNELNRCILLETYENEKCKNEKLKNIIDKGNLLALREEGAPLIKNNKKITSEEYKYMFKIVGFLEKVGGNHLNGTQLLAYSRMRHVGDGVYDRSDRQRKVIGLIIEKLKNISEAQYPFIANDLLPYLKTNIGFTEILNMAYTAYKIQDSNMEYLQIPTTKLSSGRIYKDKGWVLLMDREKNIKIMHDFIFENKKYNESEYSMFKYEDSEYYYKPKIKNKHFKSYYYKKR